MRRRGLTLFLLSVLLGSGMAASHTAGVREAAGASRAGTWSTAHLSQARQEPRAVTVGEKVLFVAGFTGDRQAAVRSTTVDIYDGATGQWSTAALSTARSNMALATIGSKVLVAGGRPGPGPQTDPHLAASDVVDVYDSRTDQWTVVRLSEPRW